MQLSVHKVSERKRKRSSFVMHQVHRWGCATTEEAALYRGGSAAGQKSGDGVRPCVLSYAKG
jgi:hypothetical protein